MAQSEDVDGGVPLREEATQKIEKGLNFSQVHDELVLNDTWWWSAGSTLSIVALLGNLLFLVTVIYNRKRHDLKTFVTAIISTVAFLDILDVARILPVLSKDLFEDVLFRHIYCSLGVFHELAVGLFLVSLVIAVCVQAGRELSYYGAAGGDPRASLAQKILIPLVLLFAAGVASPLFLLSYERLSHSCTDPFRARHVVETQSDSFYADVYSTAVTAISHILPVLVIPAALPFALLRTCISRQCCIARYKQPIGELVMTSAVCLIFLASIVGTVLPRIGEVAPMEKDYLGPAPLLWELGNNALRPIVYFLTNPAVWDGLKAMCGCCGKKGHLIVNGDVEEAELPLAPVTTV